MKAIENILTRNSCSKLIKPFPKKEEMKLVYEAALRAPDHANLKPSRFIEVTGSGLEKLSKIFMDYNAAHLNEQNEMKLKKYENAPFRSPMIIVLICELKEHPKVPPLEQMLSTAAAAQNMLLALHALNYGAIWRTGVFSLNDEIPKFFNLKSNQKIMGYLYVGTIAGKLKTIPEIDTSNFVEVWT